MFDFVRRDEDWRERERHASLAPSPGRRHGARSRRTRAGCAFLAAALVPRARSRLSVAASGQKSISVVRQASAAEVSRLGCKSWPTWSCGVSHFPWTYGEQETSLLIEGAVTVTPDGSEPVTLLAGDLATFPAGLSCVWHVTQPLRKHYSFDA